MPSDIDDSPAGLAILLGGHTMVSDTPADDDPVPDGLEDAMEAMGMKKEHARAFRNAVTFCNPTAPDEGE